MNPHDAKYRMKSDPEIPAPKPPPEPVPLVSTPRMQDVPYNIHANRPSDGVVGGILIPYKCSKLVGKILVSRITESEDQCEVSISASTEEEIITRTIKVEQGKMKTVTMTNLNGPIALKVTADDKCYDIYATILATPEFGA